MKLSWTLSYYIGRHFLLSILMALFGLAALSTLIDIVELIRRASGRDNVPLHILLEMALLRLPTLAEKLSPYAVLIGSMLALTKLTRTHELVVARAAGISVWQFLAPAVAVVIAFGMFLSTLFNPFAAALLMRYEHIEDKYMSGSSSMLAVSPSGLWLRQVEHGADGVGEYIIYTMRVSQNAREFSNLTVFTFDPKKRFIERLDAPRAQLEPGMLHLYDVMLTQPGKLPVMKTDYLIPSTLTIGHIQDSFASPETLSFWALPRFITMLENAGFSALRHREYWHSLLASPFLMAGSVLVAAVFSLRLPRRGRIGLLVTAGIVTGFLLHFFTNVINAYGTTGTLPVMLAAWTPAILVTMIGGALLLHLEDG